MHTERQDKINPAPRMLRLSQRHFMRDDKIKKMEFIDGKCFTGINVNDCTAIIVTIEHEIQRQLIYENIVSFGPKINSIIQVNNTAEEEVISLLGIKHIINGRDTIADMLAEEALGCHLKIQES